MASWTVPVLHATSDTLAVSDWNGLANDATFLYQAPYCNYYNSVAVSLGTGITQITLGGTTCTGYGFSVSSNNIIVPIAGVYFVAGQTTTPVTANQQTLIYHQSTVIGVNYSSGSTETLPVSTVVPCSASDTLSLWAYSNTSGYSFTGAALTFLAACFVGSQ